MLSSLLNNMLTNWSLRNNGDETEICFTNFIIVPLQVWTIYNKFKPFQTGSVFISELCCKRPFTTDLQALTLAGPTVTRPVLDRLAVLCLDNQPYITPISSTNNKETGDSWFFIGKYVWSFFFCSIFCFRGFYSLTIAGKALHYRSDCKCLIRYSLFGLTAETGSLAARCSMVNWYWRKSESPNSKFQSPLLDSNPEPPNHPISQSPATLPSVLSRHFWCRDLIHPITCGKPHWIQGFELGISRSEFDRAAI